MASLVDLVVAGVGVLSGGGGIYAVLTSRATRRTLIAGADKTDAEAGEVINRTAIVLLTPLHNRIKELEVEVSTLRRRVREVNDALDERELTVGRQQRQITDQQRQITELQIQVNGHR